MGVIEAVLSVIGLGFLILLVFAALRGEAPAPAPEDDLAAPYREGLHAAIRMQGAAQDLKQQLYAEADKRVRDGHEQP
jgi:hypothetical protein